MCELKNVDKIQGYRTEEGKGKRGRRKWNKKARERRGKEEEDEREEE